MAASIKPTRLALFYQCNCVRSFELSGKDQNPTPEYAEENQTFWEALYFRMSSLNGPASVCGLIRNRWSLRQSYQTTPNGAVMV